MENNFKHHCSRRARPSSAGAGSGGDDGSRGANGDLHGQHAHYCGGHYSIAAQEVELTAQAGHPRISLEAVNADGRTDGLAFVGIHGDKGVRVTTGAESGLTPTFDLATDGVEIIAELNQEVTIKRGVGGSGLQLIHMFPDGVEIDGDNAGVLIQSLHKITLQVAGGASIIELTPDGISISGLTVNINP